MRVTAGERIFGMVARYENGGLKSAKAEATATVTYIVIISRAVRP